MLSFGLGVGLSLGPGIYAYLTSRKLLSRVDDPLLPDLLLARRQRVGTAVGLAIGISLPLLRGYTLGVILGATVASLVGGFSARRRIFGESWSLLGYLGHTLRFWLAMLLSLVLVMVIPAAAKLGGVALGAFFGALAMLSSIFLARVFPAILRASPLVRPELEAPFRAVLEKARCGSPRLYEAEASGGTFVNAFAMPSLWTPGVLFTSGLLRSLDVREATAIFAHEVAHLEHHDRRHLLEALASMAILVALPLVIFQGPYASLTERYLWAWPLIVIVAFAFRMRAHRGHETESDLRGAELCSDPEALIGGLTKLHTLMRVPRRWSEKHESWSSHPSLARRIRAIRRAYESAKEAPGLEPVTFFAADASRRAAVLDEERVHLLCGIEVGEKGDPLALAAERRSIAYAALRDLRLEATKNELVVVESGGRTTRLPVEAEQARRLSELLDRIDVRLDYRAAASSGGARIVGLVVALMGVSALASASIAFLGILAAALPSIATLAAAGVGGLVASAFGLLRLGLGTLDTAFLAAASLACLGVAWGRHRRNEEESGRALLLGILVPATLAFTGLAWGLMCLASPLPVMQLHLWVRSAVGTVASLAACSAALLMARKPRARLLALPVGLLCAGLVALGALGFGQGFGGDLFASIPPSASLNDATVAPLRSVSLTETIVDLTLSPGGKHFFARVDEGERYDEPSGSGTYLVETDDGLETLEALALDFVDDGTLATVELEGDEKVLRLPGRSITLPSMVTVRLLVDPESSAWQIRGYDPEAYDTLVLRGGLDSDRFETLRFFMPEDDSAVVDAVSFDGWAVSYDYVFPEAPRLLLTLGLGAPGGRKVATEISVRRPDAAPVPVGLSLLYPSCYEVGASRARFLCVASYGSWTNLFTFDPASRAVEPLVSLAGERYMDEPIRQGRFALTRWHASPLLVDFENRRFVRLPDAGAAWEIVDWRGRTLANATRNTDGTSEVTFYRLDAEGLVH